MIDLHSHILPDIDGFDVALGMLEAYHALGVRTVFATPRLTGRLDPVTPAQLRAGAPITLAGSRVALIALPFTTWPHYAVDTLFGIQTTCGVALLAHPESYPGIQKDPALARKLVDRGILLQVTVGNFGRAAKYSAETSLAMGLAHVVATDAHSARQRMAAVPSGLKRLREFTGEADLRRLTVEAPAMLLSGDDVRPLPSSQSAGGIRRLWMPMQHHTHQPDHPLMHQLHHMLQSFQPHLV